MVNVRSASTGQKVSRTQFPSIRDQWEKGIDLFKVERQVTLSLEPDLKRRLVNPRLMPVVSRQREHLAMDSRPWRTAADFDAARNQLDAWRQTHCLKTLEDWESLEAALVLSVIRTKQRATGKGSLNLRAGQPVSDLLRRAFLRAYAHQALGLTRIMTYRSLAAWLTERGYPTKVSEPTSAKTKPLVLGQVPRTTEVMALWRCLQGHFPAADLEPLLAEDDILG